MKKTPWYKRVAIWCVVTGAMVVGAIILVWRKIQWTIVPSSFPAGEHREIRDQKLKDSVDAIEKEIERVNNEKQNIDPESSINSTNAQLARARTRRRIAGIWPRAGGTGGGNDGDQQE